MVSLIVVNIVLQFAILCRYPLHTSVAEVTRSRYGDHVLDIFRTVERISIKRDKAELDVRFLETCQAAGIVPYFLRFKLADRSNQDSLEVKRCQRRLLSRTIVKKKRLIQQHDERLSDLKSDLQSKVRYIDFVHYIGLVHRSVTRVNDRAMSGI